MRAIVLQASCQDRSHEPSMPFLIKCCYVCRQTIHRHGILPKAVTTILQLTPVDVAVVTQLVATIGHSSSLLIKCSRCCTCRLEPTQPWHMIILVFSYSHHPGTACWLHVAVCATQPGTHTSVKHHQFGATVSLLLLTECKPPNQCLTAEWWNACKLGAHTTMEYYQFSFTTFLQRYPALAPPNNRPRLDRCYSAN